MALNYIKKKWKSYAENLKALFKLPKFEHLLCRMHKNIFEWLCELFAHIIIYYFC